MANTNTFRTPVGELLPKGDTVNAAGAPAHAFSAKHALAQYAVTGCFNRTYYASAEAQAAKVVDLPYEAPPEFVAKTAIYARELSDAVFDLLALFAKGALQSEHWVGEVEKIAL